MFEGKVRIIWEDRSGSEVKVLGGVDTSIPNVLQVLSESGKNPNDFSQTVVEAKVKPHLRQLPCILWCSGSVVGDLFHGLKSRGLCRELPLLN